MIVRSEKQIDWILDLYNDGHYQVYTWNTGDSPSECGDWLWVSIGICLCWALGLIQISNYKKMSYSPYKKQ